MGIAAKYREYKNNKRIQYILTAVLALLCPVRIVFLSSYILRGGFVVTLRYLQNKVGPAMITAVPIFIIALMLAFLTRKVAVAYRIIGFVVLMGSAAHYYKVLLRGESLFPSDIVFASQAGNMIGQFNIQPTKAVVVAFILLALTVLVSRLCTTPKVRDRYANNLAIAAILAAVLFGYSRFCLFNLDFYQNSGLFRQKSEATDTYYANTFLTAFTFFYNIENVTVPENYGERSVRETMELLVEREKEQSRPDIIVILGESFFFPDRCLGIEFDRSLSENYDRMAESGIYGNMLSPKYGGGTGDIEFSVLTGINITLFSSMTQFPYIYGNEYIPSYIHKLSDMGYETYGLHAYNDTLYNRRNMYRNLGIDNIKFAEDYTHAGQLGNFISEEENFREITDTYEQFLNNGAHENVFIASASMQNHAEMSSKILDMEHAEVVGEGYTETFREGMSTVASYEYYSDRALKYLFDYFSNIDREVIVIFYGDHQAYNTDNTAFNTDCLNEIPGYAELSAKERFVKEHTTQFLIWSNKRDLGGIYFPMVSPNMLYPIAAKAVGRPIEEFEQAIYECGSNYPAVDLWNDVVFDANGEWSSVREAQESIDTSYLISYDVLKGERYSLSQN